MSDKKEKSAVGAATPATEEGKITTADIIAENSGKIKAVIQKPGEISEIVEIENSIEEMNRIVGGQSTRLTIPENGLALIMNMYSNRRGTPNLKTLWGRIFGTVVVAAKEGSNYVSLTPEQIQSARAWLLKHTYSEEI